MSERVWKRRTVGGGYHGELNAMRKLMVVVRDEKK
jgi:hypothetical protein